MKKIKKLAFLLLLTAMAGVFLPVDGQVTAPGNNLYTLYPPGNFTGHEIDCSCYLRWEVPQTPAGKTPPGIKGYIIRRAGVTVALRVSTVTAGIVGCSPKPAFTRKTT